MSWPLRGSQFLVSHQGLGADSRAVDDPALPQRGDFVEGAEFPDADSPAGEPEVPHHRAEVHRGLDHHGGEPARVAGREGMGPRREVTALGEEVGEGVRRRRAAEGDGAERVVGQPADPVADAHHVLEDAVGNPGGALEADAELVGVDLRVGDRVRRPLGAGHIRGGAGRKVLRVDRDPDPAPLEQAGGGEADRAAADHRRPRRRRSLAQQLLDREPGGSPREADPAAAVAVVVDEDAPAPEVLGFDPEARGAEGPEADHGADDPVAGHLHRGQPEGRGGHGPGRGRRAAGAGRSRAGGETGGQFRRGFESAPP